MNDIMANQAYLFLVFILNGIIIGLLFDIFRILRRSFKTPNFITYIEDIVFWIMSTLIVLYSLFVFNNGEIRFYVFLATFFGIIIYSLTLSNICVIIISVIFKIIKRLFEIIWKILKLPYHFITSFFKNRNKSLNLKK